MFYIPYIYFQPEGLKHSPLFLLIMLDIKRIEEEKKEKIKNYDYKIYFIKNEIEELERKRTFSYDNTDDKIYNRLKLLYLKKAIYEDRLNKLLSIEYCPYTNCSLTREGETIINRILHDYNGDYTKK